MSTTLNSIFTTLSNYIAGISAPSVTTADLQAQNTAITNVNTSVAHLYSAVNTPAYQSIITDQERTKNILNSQTTFLNSLTDSNANKTETERRAIQQHISHKRRYARYNAILITLSISLIICGIFVAIKNNAPFPIISQGCLAAIILILTYDVIYITNSYLDIQKRDRLDFDKIDPDAAGLPTKTELAALQRNAIASGSSDSTCVGDDCCPQGYSWNSNDNICIDTTGLISNGSSISNWLTGTTGITISTTIGNPAPSIQATTINACSYINVSNIIPNFTTFFGKTITFDMFCPNGGLVNLYFACNSNGTGNMFRFDARSGAPSGITTTTDWTNWNAPAGSVASLLPNTWYNFQIIITSSGNATFKHKTQSSLTYTTNSNTSIAITNSQTYIGIQADRGNGGYVDNIYII